METKKIVESLRSLVNYQGIHHFYHTGKYGDNFSVGDVIDEAAERLEELESELEKRTINDRPYEWISVEDRLPEPLTSVLAYDYKNKRVGLFCFKNPETMGSYYSHWMLLPEPPKPKEPTFKDVFLKAFPKTCNVCFTDFCPKTFFESIKCPLPVVCSEKTIEACWSQPYFEEETMADA